MQRSALLRSSGSGGRALHSCRCRRRSSLESGLPIRRHRRNLPVWRIHDERRSMLDRAFDHDRCAPGRSRARVPIWIGHQGLKEIVAAGEITIGVDVEDPRRPPFEFGDFLVCQQRPPGEFLRAFQRRGALVQPHALEIGLAVRSQGWRPWATGPTSDGDRK